METWMYATFFELMIIKFYRHYFIHKYIERRVSQKAIEISFKF